MRTWKIIDRGDVPENSQKAELCCECGTSAVIPVVGLAMAQVGMGLVFDIGRKCMPVTIQCRRCGRVYTTEEEE